MSSPTRHLGALLAVSCLVAWGCGGGGGNGGSATGGSFTPRPSSTNAATNTPTPRGGAQGTPTPGHTFPGGQATRTITPTPDTTPGTPGARSPSPTNGPVGPATMYVRASGNDDNDGSSPAQALRTMTSAASRSAPGTTIHVGPGVYTGRITFTRVAGTADAPIQLLADPSGRTTGDAAGDVVLDAGGDTVNLVVTRTPFMTIDGFVFRGSVPQTTPDRVASTSIGLRTQSHSVTIRNCVFTSGGLSDGVRIDASSDALVFDNLFHDNDRGIVITGDSQRTRVINNTLVNHLRTGIAIAQRGGVAPADTTVTNNIVQGNENNIAISVDEGPPSALEGYSGDFNLAFEPGLEDQTTVYRPDSIRGAQDVNADAVLANPGEGDVHLGTDSPAIDAGSDGIGSDLVDALRQRSTVVGGAPDEGNVDLGYHYRR